MLVTALLPEVEIADLPLECYAIILKRYLRTTRRRAETQIREVKTVPGTSTKGGDISPGGGQS